MRKTLIKPEAAFMKRAIELSEKAGIKDKSGGVFGAVIVKDGKIIAEGLNTVFKTKDPLDHAECNCIRNACKKLNSPHLEGCVMYTTGEPCPMCLAAAYWAHLDHIFYANTIADARKWGDFKDDDYLAEIRKDNKDRRIQCEEFMRAEGNEVWKRFHAMPDRPHY